MIYEIKLLLYSLIIIIIDKTSNHKNILSIAWFGLMILNCSRTDLCHLHVWDK